MSKGTKDKFLYASSSNNQNFSEFENYLINEVIKKLQDTQTEKTTNFSEGYKNNLKVYHKIFIEKLMLPDVLENSNVDDVKHLIFTLKNFYSDFGISDFSNTEIIMKMVEKCESQQKLELSIEKNKKLQEKIQEFDNLWNEVSEGWNISDKNKQKDDGLMNFYQFEINEPEIFACLGDVEAIDNYQTENLKQQEELNFLVGKYGFDDWRDFPQNETQAELTLKERSENKPIENLKIESNYKKRQARNIIID